MIFLIFLYNEKKNMRKKRRKLRLQSKATPVSKLQVEKPILYKFQLPTPLPLFSKISQNLSKYLIINNIRCRNHMSQELNPNCVSNIPRASNWQQKKAVELSRRWNWQEIEQAVELEQKEKELAVRNSTPTQYGSSRPSAVD